jgi:ATP-dependent DNA helicase PIF1
MPFKKKPKKEEEKLKESHLQFIDSSLKKVFGGDNGEVKPVSEMQKVIYNQLCGAFPDFAMTLKVFCITTLKCFQKFKSEQNFHTPIVSKNAKWSDDVENTFSNLIVDCDREMTLSTVPKQKRNRFKLLHSKFGNAFPDLKLSESSVKSKYYGLQKKGKINGLDPYYLNILSVWAKGVNFSRDPIFDASCYNCGCLLYGGVSQKHKFLLRNPVNGAQRIGILTNRYERSDLLPFSKSDSTFFQCRFCKNDRTSTDFYAFWCPKTGVARVPPDISSLNDWEIGQVALANLNITVVKKKDPARKSWIHVRGETFAREKFQDQYDSIYGFLKQKEDLTKPSDKNIRAALLTLRTINPLYEHFCANYETLYRYVKKCEPVPLYGNMYPEKQKKIDRILDREKAGLFVPVEEFETELCVGSEDIVAGKQHQLPFSRLKELKYVTYDDKNLEAKVFPNLFPYGIGAYGLRGPLTRNDYTYWHLLCPDSRFRRFTQFGFFETHRRNVELLLAYNRVRKAQVCGRTEPITSKNLQQENVEDPPNPFSRYGTSIPNSLPGSKSYWHSRFCDLMALSKELGRHPDFFYTVTQNDSWPEIQVLVREGVQGIPKLPDKPYEQGPFVGGEPVVDYPTECVVAFYKRLRLINNAVLHDKNGPLGEVEDFWYRIEMQKRGALHAHCVVWCKEGTIPEDAVTAEMPRFPDQPENESIREHVRKLMTHHCNDSRCLKGKRGGKKLKKCKYGFPFDLRSTTGLDDKKMQYLLKRTQGEDRNIVSYNLKLLLLSGAHLNVKMVGKAGWELYLAKYASKMEPVTTHRLKHKKLDVELFFTSRVMSATECSAIALNMHFSKCSREVIFCPTELDPKYRMLKRKCHLPEDPESGDVFYQNLLDKYLRRPKELASVLYLDFVRFYIYARGKALGGGQSSDEETDGKEDCSMPVPAKKQRVVAKTFKDLDGRVVRERLGRPAVPRYRFFRMYVPGEQESYCLQKLLFKCAFTVDEVDKIISKENQTGTYLEECMLRGVLDKQSDALEYLQTVKGKGFSAKRIMNLANEMIVSGWLDSPEVDTILDTLGIDVDEAAFHHEEVAEFNVPDQEMFHLGEESSLHFHDRYDQCTSSQRKTIQWVDQQLEEEKQVLVYISGDAGTGKSFTLDTIIALCTEKYRLSHKILSTTGCSAYLVKGTTIHSFFQLNYKLQTGLEKNTDKALCVRETEVLLIDEVSMLTAELFEKFEVLLRRFCPLSNAEKPFGGRHVFLFGDCCQLPAVGDPIWNTKLFGLFKSCLLTEVVRQKDSEFTDVLGRMRLGRLRVSDMEFLRSRKWPHPTVSLKDVENSLLLVSTNEKRHYYNQRLLDDIRKEKTVFPAIDVVVPNVPMDAEMTYQLHRYFPDRLPDEVHVKLGCKVMLTRNISVKHGWVNGTIAKVVRVNRDPGFIMIEAINGQGTIALRRQTQHLEFKWSNLTIQRCQFPLILAYALTIHKAQGITADEVFVDTDGLFCSGHLYVACSRVKTPEKLHLLGNEPLACYLSPELSSLCEALMKRNVLNDTIDDKHPLPLVRGRKRKNFKDLREDVDEIEQLENSIVSSPPHYPEFPHRPMSHFVPLKVEMTYASKKHVPFVVPLKPVASHSSVRAAVSSKPISVLRPRVVVAPSKVPDWVQRPPKPGDLESTEINWISSEDLPKTSSTVGSLEIGENLLHLGRIPLLSQKILAGCNTKLGTLKKITDSFLFDQNSVAEVVAAVRSANPLLFDAKEMQPLDSSLMSLCPPSFLESYSLVSVAGDGNCFYRAVALQLFGDSEFHFAIRVATAMAFLKVDKLFKAILEGDWDESYQQIFTRIVTNGQWATSVTVLATALGVGRPIYMYTDFGPFRDALASIPALSLLQLFLDKDPRCRQHAVYNANINSAPLTIFHQRSPGHFVPCMKLSKNSKVFIPAKNFWGRFQSYFPKFDDPTPSGPAQTSSLAPANDLKIISRCAALIYKASGGRAGLSQILKRFQSKTSLMQEALSFISKASPTHCFNPSVHHIDTQLKDQCDPLFLECYTPVVVGHTGNCFYQSVSTLLFNCEDFHHVVRVATVSMLIQHRPMFEHYLELSQGDTFHQTLLSAAYNDGWADQTTLKASALALGRDIHIYSDFRINNSNQFLPSHLTPLGLVSLFENRDPRIMQHATYNSENPGNREPLPICHHVNPGHFAPAMKNRVGVPIFHPQRTLFHLTTT